MSRMTEIADEMIQQSIKAVDPFQLIKDRVFLVGNQLIVDEKEGINLDLFKQVKLIGFGKGVSPMAAAIEEILGDRLHGGRIVVKYGHGQDLKLTDVFEAAHPIPDANSLAATASLLAYVNDLQDDDLVIIVISGGGSALLELLPENIKLSDLEDLSRLLLASGANINEINVVRKHISLVKGGRLAQIISPATCLSLILSDVIGDPLPSIASGPTAPDDSTFEDALNTLKKYNLQSNVPAAILKYLESGLSGEIIDTPKSDEPLFESVQNLVIGNNRLALKRAKQIARDAGKNVQVLTDRMEGEAREIAKMIAAMIKSAHYAEIPTKTPGCVLMGGEPTVTLAGTGKGGRNQELVLAVLIAMKGFDENFYFCSVGTDGTDGPTDAAGAWIDNETLKKAEEQNLNPQEYLNNNDAYHFFEQIGQLIKTGPTRTNVMDIAFFLV